jgi:hypothetical protein
MAVYRPTYTDKTTLRGVAYLLNGNTVVNAPPG